ncbi:hypothetical protein BSZ35_03930 [Salinibacter sp. 10B]|uniref:hypothetical protein n=1 Tax=Salinibacter sp. 10B TaxID=1923971 RepID=UPI000D2CFFC3|nr:hypothetical protein [Salinibacter sp. 10B]PQJ33862.1 hypothetical protein BSZ35_03930 [Salinibacter sp. 10B]
MTAPLPLITITEDGEAIGTLQQFAAALHLSPSHLRRVLETDGRHCVIFSEGWGPDRLLILDVCGILALPLPDGAPDAAVDETGSA